MKFPALAVLLCSLLIQGPALGADAITWVRHNFMPNPPGQLPPYKEEVLELVLSKSEAKYGKYRMVYQPPSTQARAFRELQDNQLDVIGTSWDAEREQMAQPIRFDLYKGLMGLRVGITPAERLAEVNGLSDWPALRKLPIGVGADWPSAPKFRQAGLNAVNMLHFDAGARRMRLGGMDLILLGIAEAERLAVQKGFSVVSAWGLYVDEPYYFWVRKGRSVLAERIDYGFRAAIADGSLEALFEKRIEPYLTRWLGANPMVFDLRAGGPPVTAEAFRALVLNPVMKAAWQN